MNILITGANGFLGSTIVRRARASQISFRATDLHRSPIVSGIDYGPSDITIPATLKPFLKGITDVVHTAGLAHIFVPDLTVDDRFLQINEDGTANVASIAADQGVKHFILISSVSVYGPSAGGHSEDAQCNPIGPYAISKRNAELRAEEIARKSGMALTILRLATLYGEGDRGNVRRLVSAIDRRKFVWIGNGSNQKSLLYKEDAARAILSVLQQPSSGINKYNVSAPPHTMYSIVRRIAVELGQQPPSWHIPAPLASLVINSITAIIGRNGRISRLAATLQKWLADDYYNVDKFYNTFRYKTETGLEEGIRRQVEWYKAGRRKS